MAQAILLFNGIQYKFEVVERALAWAKQNRGSILAIFLRSTGEVKEGYIFPSDLDAAEELSTTEQASAQHGQVIESNARMLGHVLRSEDIHFAIEILVNPSEDEIDRKIANAEIVFAPEAITGNGILSVDSMDVQQWLSRLSVVVEFIN